jgi:hypothetical protein
VADSVMYRTSYKGDLMCNFILVRIKSIFFKKKWRIIYSLRPILLFANMDVSTTKMCLDTSTLMKSIILPLFPNIKCFSFVKQIYLDII